MYSELLLPLFYRGYYIYCCNRCDTDYIATSPATNIYTHGVRLDAEYSRYFDFVIDGDRFLCFMCDAYLGDAHNQMYVFDARTMHQKIYVQHLSMGSRRCVCSLCKIDFCYYSREGDFSVVSSTCGVDSTVDLAPDIDENPYRAITEDVITSSPVNIVRRERNLYCSGCEVCVGRVEDGPIPQFRLFSFFLRVLDVYRHIPSRRSMKRSHHQIE